MLKSIKIPGLTRNLGVILALLFLMSNPAQAQYLESFGTPNKGYLLNCVDDFTGVNWSMTPWDPTGTCQLGDIQDSGDYFSTTAAGVLESSDLDQEVCWESPLINISTAGVVSLSVDLVWNGFDIDGMLNNCIGDYIRVMYSVSGGAYTMVPNQFGGSSCGTVAYPNPSTPPLMGSGTVTQGGISGSTLKIRVCVFTNVTAEVVTIDNVSVPQAGVTVGCAAPVLSTVVTQVGCSNPNSGAINLSVSAGTPGYTYDWSNDGAEVPDNDPQDLSGLAVGTYTVTVTDAASCSATTSVMVTSAPALSLSTQTLGVSCSGMLDGEIDLIVSGGVPGYTYDWSHDGPDTPDNDPQDLIGVGSGAYTITVTDASGCTGTANANVGILPMTAYLEQFNIANKGYLPNFLEDFSAVDWSMSSWAQQPPALFGRDADDFFRTSGGVLVGDDFDQEVCWTSPIIDRGAATMFSVGLTWTGFDNEDYINVRYSIDGGAYVTVPNMFGGGAGTIQYPFPTIDQSNSTTVTQMGLSGNTIQIQVCGNFNSETITIDNVSVPLSEGIFCPCTNPTPIITGPTSVCSGGSVMLNAGAGYSSYAWSNGGGSGQTATYSNIIMGTSYTVTVTNAGGCSGTDTHAVSVNANPTPTITGPTSVCSGGSVLLDAGAGYNTYAWSNGGGSGQTATFSNITMGTTYMVTVTSGNGCSGTDSHPVNVNSSPAPIITGPTSVCSGGSVLLDAGAGYNTYAWSNGGGSNQTATFNNILMGASYTVTVTSANGCSGTDSHSIGINANPTPIITGPTSVCSGGNVLLDAGAGYNTYAWSNGGGSGQTATFNNIIVATPYTVTVTDVNGCTGTDSHSVNVNTNPSPIVTGPSSVCSGGSVLLDAGAGYSSYAWSNAGGSSQTATFNNITMVTNFVVTVTDANSCLGTDVHTVSINPNPTPTITGPTSVCTGGSVLLDAGAGYSMYAWSNGGGSGQTATFNGITMMTTYTVTVTNAFGCTGTDSQMVTPGPCAPPEAVCGIITVYVNPNAPAYDGPGSNNIWLIPGEDLDAGSTSLSMNPIVTVRRYLSNLTFDWTTNGACIDVTPNGGPLNNADKGIADRACLPVRNADFNVWKIYQLKIQDEFGSDVCVGSVKVIPQQPLSPASPVIHYVLSSVEEDDQTIFNLKNGDVPYRPEVNETSEPTLQVYPNPGAELLHVSWDAQSEESMTISITDVTGRSIASDQYKDAKGFNLVVFDMSAQASGVYIVTLQSDTGYVSQIWLKGGE